MVIDQRARVRVERKGEEHVFGVKITQNATPSQNQPGHSRRRDSSYPGRIESHSHLEEKYYHSRGVVSDERNNEIRR
jgi:hypothetical protein